MMETAVPELHEAILLCVGIAAVYLFVAMQQLMQLKRHRPEGILAREPTIGSQLPLDEDVSLSNPLPSSRQRNRISIEAGLKRLDLEVVRLHRELQAMRDEVKRLRSERNAPNAALLYNEAMNLAHLGFSAVGIATRCGISMSEAERVAELARNPKERGSAGDTLVKNPTVNEYHEQQYDRYREAA